MCAQNVTLILPGALAVDNKTLQPQLTTPWPLQPLLTPPTINNLHLYLHLHLHSNLQLSSHKRKMLQPPPQVHNQVLFRRFRWPGLLVGVVPWKGARSTAPPLKASLTWLPYVGSTWTTTRSVPCRVPFQLITCISIGWPTVVSVPALSAVGTMVSAPLALRLLVLRHLPQELPLARTRPSMTATALVTLPGKALLSPPLRLSTAGTSLH